MDEKLFYQMLKRMGRTEISNSVDWTFVSYEALGQYTSEIQEILEQSTHNQYPFSEELVTAWKKGLLPTGGSEPLSTGRGMQLFFTLCGEDLIEELQLVHVMHNLSQLGYSSRKWEIDKSENNPLHMAFVQTVQQERETSFRSYYTSCRKMFGEKAKDLALDHYLKQTYITSFFTARNGDLAVGVGGVQHCLPENAHEGVFSEIIVGANGRCALAGYTCSEPRSEDFICYQEISPQGERKIVSLEEFLTSA